MGLKNAPGELAGGRDLDARRIAELQAEIEELKTTEELLQHGKDYLRLAIDTIPGLVWTSLPDGHIEYLNKRWLDYTGMRQEDATGWGWQAAIHPEDSPGLMDYWKSILEANEAGEYAARLRRFDGEYRWFLFRGVPLLDEAGHVMKWYGTNTDIEDLRASEHLARGQLDALTQMLEVLAGESDPDQLPRLVVNTILTQLGACSVTIWERNGGRLDLLGVTEEGQFRPGNEAGYFEGSIPVTGPAPPLWVEALATGSHLLLEDIDKELTRIFLGDGRETIWRPADLTRPFANLKAHLSAQGVRGLLIAPMRLAGQLAGIIGIRFKGTRKLRREEIDLTKALAHQAMLALELMRLSRQSREAAVVAERNRLARDIHDTLAQGFTGVIVQLEAAEDAQSRGLAGAAAGHIERALDLARGSLREARRSVHALRPYALSGKSLCAAMEELIAKMTAGTSLHATFGVEGQPPLLPREWEENLLRIGQEVLTNALRHARAACFRARLIFESRTVRLEFRDDGGGFDPARGCDGLGLRGIRERIEAMRGELTIESAPGKGTSTRVVLHLPENS